MKSINEVYADCTFDQLQIKLWTIGRIIEEFHQREQSIPNGYRKTILDARAAAQRYGLSNAMIARIEQEGAEEV